MFSTGIKAMASVKRNYGVRVHWRKRSDGTTGDRGFEVKASSQTEAELLARREAEVRSPGCDLLEIRVTERQ